MNMRQQLAVRLASVRFRSPLRVKEFVCMFSLALWMLLAVYPSPSVAASERRGPGAIMVRIMPMGDSITEGIGITPNTPVLKPPTNGSGLAACSRARNSATRTAVTYRQFLLEKLRLKGVTGVYVGSVPSLEGTVHEGHAGWTIADLDFCVQNADWLSKAQPDFILLHIGTNDAGSASSGDEMIARLNALLNHVYRTMPKTTEVVVARIIPARNDVYPYLKPSTVPLNKIIASYNEKIPGLARRFQRKGYHVSVVDMSGVIRSDSDFDRAGLHPKAAASERMAEVWAAKILELLGPRL